MGASVSPRAVRPPLAPAVFMVFLTILLQPAQTLQADRWDWIRGIVNETMVAGCVVSIDGMPIENAKVTAQCWNAEAGLPALETKTDSVGNFALSVRRGASCIIEASAKGYYGGKFDVSSANYRDDFRFVLGKGTSVWGRLTMQSGRPIPSALVHCIRRPECSPRQPGQMEIVTHGYCVADATGKFHAECLGPGIFDFEIQVERENLKYHQRSISDPLRVTEEPLLEGIVVIFDDPESERIEGIVRDEDGTPIPNAAVNAYAYSGQHWRTRTDLHGQYRLIGLGNHTYDIQCAPPESLAGYFPCVRLTGIRAGALHADITIPHRSRIEGVVKDAASGAPIPNAEVRIVRYEPRYNVAPDHYEEHPSARTDETGAFIITNLIAGNVVLEAAAEGYMEDQVIDVELHPGTNMPSLQIPLSKGAALKGNPPEDPAQCAIIEGSVLNPENRPMNAEQGIYLEYLDKPVHEVPAGYIIQRGQYRMERLMPGKYEVKAWIRGGGHQASQRHIVEAPAGKVTRVDFILDFPVSGETQ